MKTAIRKMGNSQGVIIPKPVLTEIGVKIEDAVEMTVKQGKIVIAPLHRHPREGWADDSKRLAKAGEGGLLWSEFPNDSDKDLKW
jgi:antitoxin MazE